MMGTAAYSYSPGGALAVCGSRVAALVDLPPDAGLVPGLYDLIGDPSAGLDEVLELLVSPGLRAVEHFALAEHTDEGLRTVVRGRYRAQAGAHTVEGRGLWTDRIVQTDAYTLLDPEAPDAVELPLTGGGVVLAGRLHRQPGNAPVAPRVAAPMHSPAEPSGRSAEPSGHAPGAPRVAAEEVPVLVDPRATAPAVAATPPIGAGLPGVPIPTPPVPLPSGLAGTGPTATPSATTAAGAPPEAVVGTPTARPGAESAPPSAESAPPGPEFVPSGAESASQSAGSVPSGAEFAPPTAESTPMGAEFAPPTSGHTLPTPFTSPFADLPIPPPSPSAESAERPSFIDSLPWSSPSEPAPAASATESAASDRTINRDQLPRVGVQTVVAARCPAGHLSPAYAGTCRVCGRPLPQQQPVEVPRPPLGVLRLSNGDTVVLDRGCILGRNPRVPSGHSGEQPNLVKLIDPDKDISGQHLEVRLEYWHVAVKDLGSTNGTQVVPPGEHPVTLRPNDPVMIEPGTKVILAGVFSFTFEVTDGP